MCLQSSQYKTVERLVQTLKNLCCALDEVETQNITEAVKRLRHSVNLPRTHSPKVGSDLTCTHRHTHKHTLGNLLMYFISVDGLQNLQPVFQR